MYFVISAGGTAGHINPALAVADELRKRGHDILFVGTPNHIEAKLADQAGFEFMSFPVSGFDKARPFTLISSGTKLLKAARSAKRIFKQKKPDAVATFGAYVSIPVGAAAKDLGIPYIIHEQNSVPGMANAFLAKNASVIAVTYPQSVDGLSGKVEPVVVGNPVRASFEGGSKFDARQTLDLPQNAIVLTVMGGSLGAKHINAAVCNMKDRLLSIKDLYIIHSAGEGDYENMLSQLKLSDEEKSRWRVLPYIDCMSDVLAASDLVISRAGASSLAEIMTIGVPSVLVPYPYARSDHQTLNARSCVEAGAARIIADSDIDSEEFANLVMDLLMNKACRDTMAHACKKLSGTDARIRLADIIEQAAQGKHID